MECVVCGKEIVGRTDRAIYCFECAKKQMHENKTKFLAQHRKHRKCIICGEEIVHKRGNSSYCRACEL